jgi:hypothetical protein
VALFFRPDISDDQVNILFTTSILLSNLVSLYLPQLAILAFLISNLVSLYLPQLAILAFLISNLVSLHLPHLAVLAFFISSHLRKHHSLCTNKSAETRRGRSRPRELLPASLGSVLVSSLSVLGGGFRADALKFLVREGLRNPSGDVLFRRTLSCSTENPAFFCSERPSPESH